MVPGWQLLPCHCQIDGFHLTAVRADVRLPVLQFIQCVDGMNSPRSGDVSHPKCQGNLFGETVKERVKRFKGAVVDDHAQATELRIPTFVEADSL